MAVYFDSRIDVNGDNIVSIQWHIKHALLAVATFGPKGGNISFFKNEGEPCNDLGLSRPSLPTCLAWHPTRPLLAIAFENGQIVVWSSEDSNRPFEMPQLHESPVTVLVWTGTGSRLLSGDQSGSFHVWKMDVRGRSQQAPLYSHKTDSKIVSATLMTAVKLDKDTLDISALARAAVNGDEKALDLMSWKKPKGVKFSSADSQEATAFFVGCQNGTILYVTDEGEVHPIGNTEGSVCCLIFLEATSVLVVATDTGTLTQYQISPSGAATEVVKMKLSCRSAQPQLTWCGGSVLGMALGETLVRMWDIEAGDNYTLSTSESMGYVVNAKINTIAYSPEKRVLAAGTSAGQVAFWSNTISSSAKASRRPLSGQLQDPELAWQLQPPAVLEGSPEVHQLHWGSSKSCLAVSSKLHGQAFVLSQHELSVASGSGVVVVQTDAYSAFVEVFSSGMRQLFKTPDQIHGLCTTTEHVAFNSGKNISVNEYSTDPESLIKNIGSFKCDSQFVLMYEQSIYTVEPLKVQVRNLQGTVKQLLNLTEQEGDVISMSICGSFLVCGTKRGCVKLYDLSRREAKPIGSGKFLSEAIPGSPSIRSVACNCSGSHVSIIVDFIDNGVEGANHSSSKNEPHPKLYVWDVEGDVMNFFNFSSGLGEQEEYAIAAGDVAREESAGGSRRGGSGASGGAHRQLNGGRVSRESSAGVSGRGDSTDSPTTGDSGGGYITSEDRERQEAAKELAGRYPVRHFWDSLEPKLFVVEAKLSAATQSTTGDKEIAEQKSNTRNYLSKPAVEEAEIMIVSLFATQENGILVQDSFPMHTNHSQLVGVDVPYYYFSIRIDVASRSNDELLNSSNEPMNSDHYQQHDSSLSSTKRYVENRTMRDFIGMEDADKTSKEAMMTFSYYLTLGNMDEAFKAMKLIKSESVWHNMARMCVKTRRLDVAAVCLGKMGFARAAMMMRQAKGNVPEVEAQVAILALQLGMPEEAERLMKRCNRYDLVNRLYQSMGDWDKATNIAEHHDRIHLRTTYYNHARFQESVGDIRGAIENYIKSETFRFEVPRMLIDNPDVLERFIRDKADKSLHKWWAQYMESVNEMETAIEFYESAQDYLSLVRVLCFLNREKQAANICNETGDRAACYHLARQYETADSIDDAIHFFSRAQAYSSAIRLCKDHGRDDHLVNLALLAKPEDMVEAGSYLQSRPGYEDRAVVLYHKAGLVSRAVELAFRTKQFGALQQISFDLTDKTDPALLQRCADFFMANSQFDRAVDLLAAGKQYWEALKLCVEYNVPINEALAEKLTPEKPERASAGGFSDTERVRLLEGIAEVCLTQRQYHLACKKYTQAGNRQLAMKALLKSGDTEKIIFFANVSKQRDIYVMAGNFLQSVDWRREPEVMKSIIQFYTRGRALDSLASFYEACAQVEIDDYQNYEKALGALGEAIKCLGKSKSEDTALLEQRADRIRVRVTQIRRFLNAKGLLESNSEEGMQQCQSLLEEPGLGEFVRIGDVYSVMIKHFVGKQKFKAAYACLEEMKRKLPRAIGPQNFMDGATLSSIYTALNMAPPRQNGVGNSGASRRPSHPDEDEVEEDVTEAIDEDY